MVALDAADAVRTILGSPGYCQADEDADFLQRDDTRAVRLGLDHLKPELLLRDHDVATFLVHGEERAMQCLAERMTQTPVEQPTLHHSMISNRLLSSI